MAKIQEETISIKFSKLFKDSDELGKTLLFTPDLADQLVLVAQELVGPDVVVEVEVE